MFTIIYYYLLNVYYCGIVNLMCITFLCRCASVLGNMWLTHRRTVN